MKLSLFNLHNYRDRVIISRPLVSNYTALLGSPITISNINFIANDGIRTEQIVNYPQTMPLYCDGTAAPSYVIVSEDYNSNYIVSRWWVIGSQILRNGQARLSLLRDVLADYDDVIKKKPMFIKKGWINSVNDPAVLNSEDMTFNQIKKQELPIKDKSGAAWYVGYLSKDLKEDKTITVPASNLIISGDYTNSTYPYGIYDASNPYISEDYSDFIVNFAICDQGLFNATSYIMGWDKNGNATTPYARDGWSNNVNGFAYGVLSSNVAEGVRYNGDDPVGLINHVWTKAQADAKTQNWVVRARSIMRSHSAADTETLLREQGKIYKFGNVYKRVNITSYPYKSTRVVYNGDVFTNGIIAYATSFGNVNKDSITDYAVRINYNTTVYVVNLIEIPDASAEFILAANRAHLTNEPFDMFAIPATSCKILGTDLSATSPSLCRSMVAGIIEALPKGNATQLFDIQLVPYCPFPDYILGDTEEGINLTAFGAQGDKAYRDFTTVGVGGEVGIILYASNNEFRKTVFTNPITVPTEPLQYKVDSQTKMYRLCSPNYNGQFEFSAEKNGGVQGWNIDFTYKPYMPYIRVAPIFGRLYGQDFGDARGLICGGDFSITQTNDVWEQYQLENKNYQAIFDRQITNMEVNNSVQRRLERVNLITGAASGGVSGGLAGNMMGGGLIGLATGMAGFAISGLGGIQDFKLNDMLRNEAVDYAKDQFGYQLQQIQAMPYTLNKVGVQNVNYKYFPFLEIYESTETEAAALTNKIKWNGMTIMRIGTIPDFIKTTEDDIGTFIQATPLRITTYTAEDKTEDGIEGASLFLDVIAAELEQGVYYK